MSAAHDSAHLGGVVAGSSACAFLSREVSLDPSTGRELPRAENEAPVDPNVHGDFRVDVVYPGSVSGAPDVNYMRVPDRVTGTEWQVPVDDSMVLERNEGTDFPFAASDGRAYAFARPDILTAYDARSGTVNLAD